MFSPRISCTHETSNLTYLTYLIWIFSNQIQTEILSRMSVDQTYLFWDYNEYLDHTPDRLSSWRSTPMSTIRDRTFYLVSSHCNDGWISQGNRITAIFSSIEINFLFLLTITYKLLKDSVLTPAINFGSLIPIGSIQLKPIMQRVAIINRNSEFMFRLGQHSKKKQPSNCPFYIPVLSKVDLCEWFISLLN